MRAPRWDELPEARQLARLGKGLSRAAQMRLQWMLFYFFNGRSVVRTCRHFGISRQTFYRWLRRFDRHDLTTLEERSHRPRKVRQPTWTAELAERVLFLRKDNGYFALNFGLARAFHLGERMQLIPKLEVFNLFNNKNNVNTLSTGTPLFDFDGFIRHGVGDPREAQLSIRLAF